MTKDSQSHPTVCARTRTLNNYHIEACHFSYSKLFASTVPFNFEAKSGSLATQKHSCIILVANNDN